MHAPKREMLGEHLFLRNGGAFIWHARVHAHSPPTHIHNTFMRTRTSTHTLIIHLHTHISAHTHTHHSLAHTHQQAHTHTHSSFTCAHTSTNKQTRQSPLTSPHIQTSKTKTRGNLIDLISPVFYSIILQFIHSFHCIPTSPTKGYI